MARVTLETWLSQQQQTIRATKEEFDNVVTLNFYLDDTTQMRVVFAEIERVLSLNPDKDLVITMIDIPTHRVGRG